ncbi:hypothetical protein IAU59_002450 [Kwoniella sp. CBS 9459]
MSDKQPTTAIRLSSIGGLSSDDDAGKDKEDPARTGGLSTNPLVAPGLKHESVKNGHEKNQSKSDSPGAVGGVSEPEIRRFIRRLLRSRVNYIGINGPGDFNDPTYRVVMPSPNTRKRGRGYRGIKEEIALRTARRGDIDRLVGEIERLAGTPSGPIAVRHILNPSHAKDEGIRLVWREDGTAGREELEDWPRRDRLIREGKTVRSASQVDLQYRNEVSGDIAFTVLPASYSTEYGYGHWYTSIPPAVVPAPAQWSTES